MFFIFLNIFVLGKACQNDTLTKRSHIQLEQRFKGICEACSRWVIDQDYKSELRTSLSTCLLMPES